MIALPHNKLILFIFAFLIIFFLTACSKQDWYQSTVSAHKQQCVNGPISEYNDCMIQSDNSYNEYEKKREVVLTEPSPN